MAYNPNWEIIGKYFNNINTVQKEISFNKYLINPETGGNKFKEYQEVLKLLDDSQLYDHKPNFDFFFLYYYPIICGIDANVSHHYPKKKFREQLNKLEKIFSEYKGDYLGGYKNNIFSITISTKENGPYRFDNEFIIHHLNHCLYREYLNIKNKFEKVEPKINSYNQKAIKRFIPFYKYLQTESNLRSKIEVYNFIYEFIKILGFDLNEKINQLPEDYLKKILNS